MAIEAKVALLNNIERQLASVPTVTDTTMQYVVLDKSDIKYSYRKHA